MSTDPSKRPFYSVIPLLFSQTIGAFNDNAMKAILPAMAWEIYNFLEKELREEKLDEVNIHVSILLILFP